MCGCVVDENHLHHQARGVDRLGDYTIVVSCIFTVHGLGLRIGYLSS